MQREIVDGHICQLYNCHQCCIETEMLLTKLDIRRIVRKTSISAKEFVILNEDGRRMLRNHQIDNKVQCYFLDSKGLCSIYEIRPEGCKFYPFIWDMTNHHIIVDDYCPHHSKFGKSPSVTKNLEEFIFRLFGKL